MKKTPEDITTKAKFYRIVCEVNNGGLLDEKFMVRAESSKKAKSLAINMLYKKGYYMVKVLSCEEMGDT